MKSFLALLALLACTVLASGQSESEIRDRVVGTWKLVLAEQTLKDGSTRPFPEFGPHARGFLLYNREGYMCADLVNPDRPKWTNNNHPTPDERIAAGEGSFAYCGRYEIDAKQNQL